MKKTLWVIGVFLVIGIVIYLLNFFTIIQPTMSEVNKDSRNEGISIEVHYKYYIIPSDLIFNLRNVSHDKAAADVFRVFLQTSYALKDKEFNTIELQYKGKSKFTLNGNYYKQIGSEFESQNPIYTMRTLPENLMNPNGELSYSKSEGGMLGVLSKQIEDFNDFTNKWYLEDITNEMEK